MRVILNASVVLGGSNKKSFRRSPFDKLDIFTELIMAGERFKPG
jgi:hypothetical protein